MKKLLLTVITVLGITSLAACGKTEVEDSVDEIKMNSIQILPEKIENVGTKPTIPADSEADEHDSSVYPLEYLGGVWVVEGLFNDMDAVSASEKTMKITVADIEYTVESMPVQMNLMPYKDDPFVECGVAYGVFSYKVTELDNLFADPIIDVPVIFDTHKNLMAVGTFDKPLSYQEGVLTYYDDTAVEIIELTETQYEIEWTGWNLTLTSDATTVSYIPSDIDSGIGVSFAPEVYSLYGSGIGVRAEDDVYYHEDYEPMNNIMSVAPVTDEGTGQIQCHLEKPKGANYSFIDNGTVAITTESNDEMNYDFLYSGRSLVLMDEEQHSLYSVYAEKTSTSTSAFSISMRDEHFMSLGNLYMDDQPLKVKDTLQDWFEIGAFSDVNPSQLLGPNEKVDITLSLGDERFTATLVNIYDTHIQYAEAYVGSVYFDSKESDVIFTDIGDGLSYNVSTMQDIFDYWDDIPMEITENSLTYKAPLSYINTELNFDYSLALSGVEQRKQIVKDDGERYINYIFQDDILVAVEHTAPALLYSGLQDNIAGDELMELQPSFVGSVVEVRDTILDQLVTALSTAGVSVTVNPHTGEVVMSNAVLFGVDEYELTAEGKTYIDSFINAYASVLLNDQFAGIISEIAVEGHCDPTGSDAYNKVLSQKRADSVKNWCLDSTSNNLTSAQKDKMAELITAKGYSFSDLIYDSMGNVDNEASRRVAIKFYIDMTEASKMAE